MESRPQKKAPSDWFYGNVMQDPIIEAEFGSSSSFLQAENTIDTTMNM